MSQQSLFSELLAVMSTSEEEGGHVTKVLGIDPGSHIIGYGLVGFEQGKRPKSLHYGVLKIEATSFSERLLEAEKQMTSLLERLNPEFVFMERTPMITTNLTRTSNIMQVRGVCVLQAAKKGLDIVDYSPLQIKKFVSGNGRAKKPEMQSAIKRLLRMVEIPTPDDAADGLCIAYHGLYHQILKTPSLGGSEPYSKAIKKPKKKLPKKGKG